jgi:2-keto-4-pentenoate hydratase/2-oxohepta-3-ene-1,7-dioic acid hydratase in catechol pathway
VVVEDQMIDVQDAIRAHGISAPAVEGRLDVLPMLDDWDNWLPVLHRVAEACEPATSARDVRFLAPIRYPRKLLMAGANYSDHIKEMGAEVPDKTRTGPYFFQKPPTTSIVAPGEHIVIPKEVNQADWESELVAVIGRPARHVSVDQAMDYVAGYTVLNDISARDRQARRDWYGPFQHDWMLGKGFEGFAPMGPTMTPREFVPDPHHLRITCEVNDEMMQDGNTRDMIFTIPEQIAYLSRIFTLEPGDCISTGTPAGVGRPRGIFLEHGDQVVSEVEGVCRLAFHIDKEGQTDAPGH